ncbi:hypothetical protein ACM66B_002388 [Microbotryomycetes sp. NB124-2]
MTTAAAGGHDADQDDDAVVRGQSVSRGLQSLPFGLGQRPKCDKRTCTQPDAPIDFKSTLAEQVSNQLIAIFSTFFQTSLRYLGVNEILDYLEQSRTIDTWLLAGLQQGWPPDKLADEHNLELGRTALKDVILDALELDDEAWACSLREVGFSSGLSMAFEGIVGQLKYSLGAKPPCLHTLMTPTGLSVLKSAPLKHSFPVCPPRNPPSPQELITSIRNLISSGLLTGPAWSKPQVWRAQVRKAFNKYHALIKEIAEEVVTSPSFAVEFQIFIDSVASPLELFRMIADDFETEFGSTMNKGLLCVGDAGGANLYQIMDFCDAHGPSELVARVKARVAEKKELNEIKAEVERRRQQIEAFKKVGATMPSDAKLQVVKQEVEKLEQEMAVLMKRVAALERPKSPHTLKKIGLSNGKAVNGADTSTRPLQGSSKDLIAVASSSDPFAATAPRAVSPAQSLKGKGKAPASKSHRPAPALGGKKALPILPRPVSPAAFRPSGSPASAAWSTQTGASPVSTAPTSPSAPLKSLSQNVGTRQSSPATSYKTTSPVSSKMSKSKSSTTRSSFDDDMFDDCACCSACASEMLHKGLAPVLAQRSISTSPVLSSFEVPPPAPPTVIRSGPLSVTPKQTAPVARDEPPSPAAKIEDRAPSPAAPEEAAPVLAAKVESAAPVVTATVTAQEPTTNGHDAGNVDSSLTSKKPVAKKKKQTKKKAVRPATTEELSRPPIATPAITVEPAVKPQEQADRDKIDNLSILRTVIESTSEADFATRLEQHPALAYISSDRTKPKKTLRADKDSIDFPFVPERKSQPLENWMPRSGRLPPKSCPPDRCTGDKPNHAMWRWLDGLLYEVCLAAFKYELIYNIADPLATIRDKLAREFLLAGLKMTTKDGKPVDMNVYIERYEIQMWAAVRNPEVQLVTRRTLAIALIKLVSVFTAQLGPVCVCTLSDHPELLANALTRLREGEEADRLEPVDLAPIDHQEFFKWTHTQIRAGVLSGPEWEGLGRQRRVTDYLYSFEDSFQAAVDRMMVRRPYQIADDMLAMLEYVGGVRAFDTAMRLCLNTVDVDDGAVVNGVDGKSEPGSLGDDVLLPVDGPLASWERMVFLSVEQVAEGRALGKQQAEDEKQKGNQQFAAQQYPEAVVSFSTASLMVPSDPTYWTNCAAARIKIGTDAHMSQALADCTVALELDPKNIKALYRRAVAMNHLELFEDALDDLERLLKLSPGNEPARELFRQINATCDERRDPD